MRCIRFAMRVVWMMAAVAFLTTSATAQDADDDWDVTLARGETYEIDFETDEGTFMSVDVSPDGTYLVFDLLAHIYRVPVEGGEAECLTADSGVALNFHPRISPDGTTIAFVSDRGGQNNLWVMDADGSNPRQVFEDLNVRVFEPAWMPDSDYIVVRRQSLGRPRTSGIWMYHREGGSGIELVKKDVRRASWPSISSDGRDLYYQFAPGPERDLIRGALQLNQLGDTLDEVWPEAKPYGEYPWLLEGIYEMDERPVRRPGTQR